MKLRFSFAVQRDEIVNGVCENAMRHDGKKQLDTIIIVIKKKSFAQYVVLFCFARQLKCIIKPVE